MYDAFALRSVDLQPTDPKRYEEETWQPSNFPQFRGYKVRPQGTVDGSEIRLTS